MSRSMSVLQMGVSDNAHGLYYDMGLIGTTFVEIQGQCCASPTPHCSYDSWPCLSLDTIEEELTLPHHRKGAKPPALERNGPTPHHRHMKAVADGMSLGDLALPLTWWDCPGLTSSATIQIQILSLGLAHPFYDLLECVKGLVLWNNICRISKTWSNIRWQRGLEPDQWLTSPNVLEVSDHSSQCHCDERRGIGKTEWQGLFLLFVCLFCFN